MKKKPPLITIDLNKCAPVLRWQQQMAGDGEAASQKLRERLPASGAALGAQQKPADKWGRFGLLALMKTELINVIKNFGVSNVFLS